MPTVLHGLPRFPQRSAQASPQRRMIGVLVATEVENLTRCGICRRSLLLGESAAVFQDDRTRAIHTVCALCTQRAERAGWTTVGEPVSRPRLRVHTNNPAVGQDRLVQRLQADLERMQRELRGRQRPADQRALRHGRRAGPWLGPGAGSEGARRAHRRAGARDRQSATRASTSSSAQLREALEEHEALRKARRREADAAYLGGIAAEVFNRSPHRQEIANLAARMGEPTRAHRGGGHHAAASGAGHLRAGRRAGAATASLRPGRPAVRRRAGGRARSTASSSRRSARCAATRTSSTAAWCAGGATA